MYGFKTRVPKDWKNPNKPSFTKKHKVLFIGYTSQDVASWRYLNPLVPEDAFYAGALVETCSWDSFVRNLHKWEKEIDVLVIGDGSYISYAVESSLADITDAVTDFITSGGFLIWCHNQHDLNFRKYNAVGTLENGPSMSAALDGLTRGSKSFTGSGQFVSSQDSPFDDSVIRSGKIGAKGAWTNNYSSSDPDTIFPVLAVENEVVGNITAYKPGKFFIVGYGGSTNVEGGGTDWFQSPFYNYIFYAPVLQHIFGKTKNIRLSLDCAYGRKIASVGVDCDNAGEKASAIPLFNAYKNKAIEFGLVADKITAEMGDWWKSRIINTPFELCSHTYSHGTDASLATISVVDEEHTISSDLLVRLNRPYAKNLTVKIGETTLTRKGDLDTVPGANEYSGTLTSTILLGGLVKFNTARSGQTVLISYTAMNEAKEYIGSLEPLKEFGVLTRNAIYTTFNLLSVQPSTYEYAERNSITICTHDIFPSYPMQYNADMVDGKRAFNVSTTMKYIENIAVRDTTWVSNGTKAEAKANATLAITRCNSLDLPYHFYIHDFLFSETYGSSVWIKATYNPDWKQSTYAETVAYLQEMHEWLVAQLDAEDVVWIPRSVFAEVYQYLNENIIYDVEEFNDRTLIHVSNKGNKIVPGITFRIPMAVAPTKVTILQEQDIDYIYEDGILKIWWDLSAGETLTVEIV